MLLIALLATAAAHDVCGDKDNQTAMNQCEGARAQRTDAEMNRVWKLAYTSQQNADRDADPQDPHRPGLKKGEPGFAAALLAAQRAWLTFRNAECRVEGYEWYGGSMQPFAESQCMADVTEVRSRQLRLFIANNR